MHMLFDTVVEAKNNITNLVVFISLAVKLKVTVPLWSTGVSEMTVCNLVASLYNNGSLLYKAAARCARSKPTPAFPKSVICNDVDELL